MTRPNIGDRIEMPFMGADVKIRVESVPEDQPGASEGVFTIVDQYGEEHEVELDGDTWVTAVNAF